MRHRHKQADPDVARTLVAGISGIHPARIGGYALFTHDTERGIHLTTDGCCVYHAVGALLAAWTPELTALAPCSGDRG